MKKFLIILGAALITSGAACAQGTQPAKPIEKPVEIDFVKPTDFKYGQWRSSIIGGGGYVQNVVPCPSNPQRFYAYVDVGGFSRSDDGGKSWRMLHGNLPGLSGNSSVRGLVVDPRDDKKILVATGGRWAHRGIYLSDDGGATFKQTLTAHYDGNGGARAAGFLLSRAPGNPDFVATAAIGDGVFTSHDNGQTWTPGPDNVKNLFPTDIHIDRINTNRLWLSAIGRKVDDKQFLPGFFRSDDGGVTWAKLSDAPPLEIAQDPKDASTLFGMFNGEIIRKSTDGGATWEDFSEGLQIKRLEPGKSKDSIEKTNYQSLGVGPDFIVTCNTKDSDFYMLKTGATKWEKIERNAPEVGDWYHKGGWTFGAAAGSITVDPNDAKHWFMTDFFAIYQTHDSGKNWRLSVDGLETTVAHCFLQDPTDPGTVHVGLADVGNFNSADGGLRFRKASVPDDKEVKDGDGGGGNMKLMDLNRKVPNRLYGVANRNWGVLWEANQVFISIDRGQTWTRSPMIGLPPKVVCSSIVADLNDPYTVYLTVAGPINETGGGGIYKSTDGGAHWAWMSQGMPTKQWENWYFPSDIWAHGRQLAASADGSLIAISKQQNLVYRFDPKTRKWERAGFPHGGQFWSVAADRLKPGRYFIGARSDGAYRTDDSGLTWKKIYNKGISFIETDAAVAGRVAGSTEDGIVLSTDGGETWKDLDKAMPAREDAIPGFAGERLFAATLGSGVLWIPLSAAGEKAIAAKPLVKADAPLKGALPELVNLNADAEGEVVPGWKTEATTGEVKLVRDTALVAKDSPASLLISTGGATGTVYQEWTPTLWRIKASGLIQARGDFKKIVVQLQTFDAAGQALAPIVLREQKANNYWWDGFDRTICLPTTATRARLEVAFEGKGQIWLDNFNVSLPEPLFPQ